MTNSITITETNNTISVTNTPNQITVYDGAEPGPSYVDPSYSNQYGSGNRLSVLKNRMFVGSFGGSILPIYAAGGYYFDGDFSALGYPSNGADITGDQISFDFTGLVSPTFKITEMKFYFGGTMNCGTWKPQELREGVWADIGASFVLGASNPTVIDCSSSTGSSMFRLLGVSGTSSWDQYWQEIEFKIGAEA
jgi:hypothetical protein